jgi:hypothetical protein
LVQSHGVVCEESWQIVTKNFRYAWLSVEPLEHKNIHERCNLGVRHRWNIESELLAERRRG